MKILVICILGLGGLGFLASCGVEHREPTTRTTTTTTEETTVRKPVTSAVETTTYRSN